VSYAFTLNDGYNQAQNQSYHPGQVGGIGPYPGRRMGRAPRRGHTLLSVSNESKRVDAEPVTRPWLLLTTGTPRSSLC
jgi:hypothetical protein